MMTVVVMGSTMLEIGLLQRVLDGVPVTDEELISNDDRQLLLGALDFMVFIATVVVSLAWVYRTSKNLVALGADGQRFSPRWAVICWFIPIISLFRPYQVVREVWNASAPDLQPGDRSWQEAGGTPFIKWW